MAVAPTPWNAKTRQRLRLWPWMTLGGLATSAIVALGFVLADQGPESKGRNGLVSPLFAEQAQSVTVQTADDSYRTDANRPSTGAPVRSADAKANSSKSNSVVRKGAFVEMAFEGIPLVEAIASLGAATGGRVHGISNLASVTSLVNVRWHGSGLEAAWSALLSPVANSAVACGPQSCDVWIVGVRGNEGSSEGGAHLPEQLSGRGRPTAADSRRTSEPMVAALPIETPPVPRARRNDGALEAKSAD